MVNGDGSGSIVEGMIMTPKDGNVVENAPVESTQPPITAPQNLSPPINDISEAIKSLNDLMSSKQIIEHHLAFAEECVSATVFTR